MVVSVSESTTRATISTTHRSARHSQAIDLDNVSETSISSSSFHMPPRLILSISVVQGGIVIACYCSIVDVIDYIAEWCSRPAAEVISAVLRVHNVSNFRDAVEGNDLQGP